MVMLTFTQVLLLPLLPIVAITKAPVGYPPFWMPAPTYWRKMPDLQAESAVN
jgi:hypothetical protein